MLFSCFILCSFGGKDRGITDELRRIAILSSGKWQLIDNYARFNVNGNEVKNSKWHQLDTCFKDNLMVLAPKGKVYHDQGKIKCHAMARSVDSSFTWRLENVDNYLWLESSTYTQPLYIEYLTDSVLIVNEFLYFGDSSMIKVYKHIFPVKRTK